MNRKYKAIVRYDGTNFAGWQVQPKDRTVQGVIEAALHQVTGEFARIEGAGRTDSGVHALAQVFSFALTDDVDTERLRRSLSQMLSPEIALTSVVDAAPDFHARYSATGKRYAYAFSQSREPDPFSARYAWKIPPEVSQERVVELAQRFVGEHDFAGYAGSRSDVENTVRTIHSTRAFGGGTVGPMDAESLWRLEFYGTGFLYKMIRNIVGTLVDVARGAIPEERVDEGLRGPGPYRGYTAPAHGLTLVEVEYGAG